MTTYKEVFEHLRRRTYGDGPSRTYDSRELHIDIVNDAVEEAAKRLFESGDPAVTAAWTFNITNGQTNYSVRQIILENVDATPGFDSLEEWQNFGRTKSLWMRDQTNKRWLPIKVRAPEVVLPVVADDDQVNESPFAYMQLVPFGHPQQIDYEIVLPNPPRRTVTDGGMLRFFALPTRVPAYESGQNIDNWQIPLPPYTTRYIKVWAEAELYRVAGRSEPYLLLMGDQGPRGPLLEALQHMISAAQPMDDFPDFIVDNEPDDWDYILAYGVI